MQCKIAVVQFEIQQFEPEKNLKKAERFIQEAISSQAQIIVFPRILLPAPCRAIEHMLTAIGATPGISRNWLNSMPLILCPVPLSKRTLAACITQRTISTNMVRSGGDTVR